MLYTKAQNISRVFVTLSNYPWQIGHSSCVKSRVVLVYKTKAMWPINFIAQGKPIFSFISVCMISNLTNEQCCYICFRWISLHQNFYSYKKIRSQFLQWGLSCFLWSPYFSELANLQVKCISKLRYCFHQTLNKYLNSMGASVFVTLCFIQSVYVVLLYVFLFSQSSF